MMMENASGIGSGASDASSRVRLPAHPKSNYPAQLNDGSLDLPVGGGLKRAFDIALSSAALLLLAPALLLIMLAIRLESPGPAIYRQWRGGFGGRPFQIWKLRTMRVCEDAHSVKQAVAGDPRVTQIGGFLRRTSIDELPQLVNVLIGDMSLIGPRPHALRHDREFAVIDPRYNERQRARPGITGLAQTRGCRGPTGEPIRVKNRTGYDVAYVRNWSFGRDLAILARTLMVIWGDPDAL